MRLIVMTRPDFFEGEEDWIEAIVEAGADLVHIRKPQSTREQMRMLLSRLYPQSRTKVVLHDHFALAEEYGVGGVHLNMRNRALPRGWNGQCSRSCHSLQEVELHKAGCDYLTLSPIFDSISKRGYNSGFTSEQLADATERGTIDNKVVALGGITAERIEQIQNFGFGGIALLGEIWNKPSADAAAKRIEDIKDRL